MKNSLYLVIVASLLAVPAESEIASYTFDGEVASPTTFDARVGASSFSLNPGTAITYPAGNAPTTTDAISGTGWNGTEGSKWWEFTITSSQGNVMNLTSLTFDDQKSGSGPAGWSMSINGTSAASGMTPHSVFASDPMNAVDLSGPDFQGLESATVRLFGFGASGSSGTWRIDNVNLGGSVMAVPEPRAYPFLAGLALLAMGLYRRYQFARA